MGDKWFVIVNPNAGRQKGSRDWPGIARLLSEYGIDYFSSFTQNRGHAMELTKSCIHEGFSKIIVAGGDGTLNEVVNGIFSQTGRNPSEITLAMIPLGTGNDWCRMFQIAEDYKQAVEVIRKGKEFLQDLGIIEFFNAEGKKEKRCFANIAGMGFDALVLQKTNLDKEKGRGNQFSYYLNIFTSLFSFKVTQTKITLDESVITPQVFSMTAAIGQYNGGGMKQAPRSCPDDGLFDLTIIRKISKFKVIRNVLRLLDGSFTRLPEVSEYRSSTITIESTPDLYAEVDGESIGKTPFRFTILPRSLRIITGN